MEELQQSGLVDCCNLLVQKQMTIAFVESATAGRISAEFALMSDAGKFLKGAVVCYDADLKSSLLGVSKNLINTFTAESDIITCLITSGLKNLIAADIHVGCTGLTSPGGSENPDKPVGTMFICGIRHHKLIFQRRLKLEGDPESIVLQTVDHVAINLYQYLERL